MGAHRKKKTKNPRKCCCQLTLKLDAEGVLRCPGGCDAFRKPAEAVRRAIGKDPPADKMPTYREVQTGWKTSGIVQATQQTIFTNGLRP